MSLVALTEYKLNLKSQYKVVAKKIIWFWAAVSYTSKIRFWLVTNHRFSQVQIANESSHVIRYKWSRNYNKVAL